MPTLDRLNIRGIPEEVFNALSVLAERNGRSLEGEGRAALRAAAYPYLLEVERKERMQGIAARLNTAVAAANRRRFASDLPPLKTSHLAEAIGETHAEPTERWFLGDAEPSFEQVRLLAQQLEVDPVWLQHG